MLYTKNHSCKKSDFEKSLLTILFEKGRNVINDTAQERTNGNR